MIVSQTPYPVAFFGGGTDYPAYYLEHGGKLLGAGGGEGMLFYVRREDRKRLIRALYGSLVILFWFDFDGSKIIVYNPNYRSAA